MFYYKNKLLQLRLKLLVNKDLKPVKTLDK